NIQCRCLAYSLSYPPSEHWDESCHLSDRHHPIERTTQLPPTPANALHSLRLRKQDKHSAGCSSQLSRLSLATRHAKREERGRRTAPSASVSFGMRRRPCEELWRMAAKCRCHRHSTRHD